MGDNIIMVEDLTLDGFMLNGDYTVEDMDDMEDMEDMEDGISVEELTVDKDFTKFAHVETRYFQGDFCPMVTKKLPETTSHQKQFHAGDSSALEPESTALTNSHDVAQGHFNDPIIQLDSEDLVLTPSSKKPVFPNEVFLQIIEALVKDLPQNGDRYKASGEDSVHCIVAAICLGLTNSVNWDYLHRVTGTSRPSSVWLSMRGKGKKQKARRATLEKCLKLCLASWMLPKYRLAQLKIHYNEWTAMDFEIPHYGHGNALFLSREVFGDKPEWGQEELKLVKRYADRKVIIHKAHCHASRDGTAVYPWPHEYSAYNKLPRESRPPKPFGMGDEWHAAAAVSYYKEIVSHWNGWSNGARGAWAHFRDTDVYTWAMNLDSDKDYDGEVLQTKKVLRRIESEFDPSGLLKNHASSTTKAKRKRLGF